MLVRTTSNFEGPCDGRHPVEASCWCQRVRGQTRERAGQAMHALMVWWLCHGVTDVDAFYCDLHGMWGGCLEEW